MGNSGLQIVLYQTDIPQNLGSILRTSVAFGVKVHIVEPLGFVWDDDKMKRAGMDYLDRANFIRHKSWQRFLDSEGNTMQRLVLLTTKGSQGLSTYQPQIGDYIMFGRESAGVPDDIHESSDVRIRIPMVAGERSINLAQTCAIVMYDTLNKLNALPLEE